MAREMGKPVRDGVAEVQKCAGPATTTPRTPSAFSPTKPIETEARKSYVVFQPLGVVLAVMPWNFPFWQVFRFAAPALMAGNVAAAQARLQRAAAARWRSRRSSADAGFPEGLFRTLLIGSQRRWTRVIERSAACAP